MSNQLLQTPSLYQLSVGETRFTEDRSPVHHRDTSSLKSLIHQRITDASALLIIFIAPLIRLYQIRMIQLLIYADLNLNINAFKVKVQKYALEVNW